MSIRRFIQQIWQPERRLLFCCLQFPVFIVLYIAELFYRLGFALHKNVYKIFVQQQRFPAHVISVGNLSVGGTGKSVFVRYLIAQIGVQKCGVVMRGYGGKNEKKKKPLFVTKKTDVRACGDEAYELVCATNVATVVCANKQKAIAFLLQHASQITTIILDDGYQTHSVYRDENIVLLDGRKPFGNGHCLPAGPLRETDLSRATCIVVTHSDRINKQQKKEIVERLERERGALFVKQSVLWGRHSLVGIFRTGEKKVGHSALIDKRFYVAAGIGSFSQFCSMLRNEGIKALLEKDFQDHYNYQKHDIAQLLSAQLPLIVTDKDWVKIEPLVRTHFADTLAQWYVARVSFAVEKKI